MESGSRFAVTRGVGAALLILASVAIACGPGRCIARKEITYRITREGEMVEGVLTPVMVEVTNGSNLYMLVERLTGGHAGVDGRESLYGSRYGALHSLEDGTGYEYDGMAQQETPAVFSQGLVPPHQGLRMEVDLVPTGPTAEFVVDYIGLTPEEVTQYLYFPVAQEQSSTSTWQKPSLDQMKSLMLPADGEPRHPVYGTVIVADELLRARAGCRVELPYKFSVKSPPLPADEVRKRLGTRPRWQLYSEKYKGWFVRGESGMFFMDPERDLPVPNSPNRLFEDLEGQDKVRVKVGARGNAMVKDKPARLAPSTSFLEGFAPLSAGDGMYTQGAFMDVTAERALEFLELLQTNGCSLVLHNYYMDSYYYEMGCPSDD